MTYINAIYILKSIPTEGCYTDFLDTEVVEAIDTILCMETINAVSKMCLENGLRFLRYRENKWQHIMENMTLRDKLKIVAEPYDLFPDLSEKEKAEIHIEVLAEKHGIDLTTVVRCRDCIYWSGNDDESIGTCEKDALIREWDFYCKNGERR